MPMRADDQRQPERRRSRRQSVELPIWFRSELMEFEGDALFGGEVLDVSEGGVFIRSDYLELPGTYVRLVIALPDGGAPVELDGRVAWIAEAPPNGPGMGIELSEVGLAMHGLMERALPVAEA